MKIAVIGLGTMGTGIVQALTEKGVAVTGLGRREEAFESLRETITKRVKMGVRLKRADKDAAEAGVKNLKLTTDMADLKGCDLIIEAVTEEFHIKVKVLKEASLAVADTPIASNTSCLSIARLGSEAGILPRFFGLHFMNPVAGSNMVEIISHNTVEEECLKIGKALVDKLELTAIALSDSPGFIVNRLLMPMIAEAACLLQTKDADAEAIDTAMRLGCGHPMGPLALADMIGLDLVLTELRQLEHDLGPRFEAPENLCQLVSDGHLGRKTGKGFYNYHT